VSRHTESVAIISEGGSLAASALASSVEMQMIKGDILNVSIHLKNETGATSYNNGFVICRCSNAVWAISLIQIRLLVDVPLMDVIIPLICMPDV
jgi:hypothetical protein